MVITEQEIEVLLEKGRFDEIEEILQTKDTFTSLFYGALIALQKFSLNTSLNLFREALSLGDTSDFAQRKHREIILYIIFLHLERRELDEAETEIKKINEDIGDLNEFERNFLSLIESNFMAIDDKVGYYNTMYANRFLPEEYGV